MVQQGSFVMTLTAAAAICIATGPALAQFDQCPNEKGGNCHEATPGIGGCCDEACCNMVCDVDPACCIIEWDEACAAIAVGLGCGGVCGDGVLLDFDAFPTGPFSGGNEDGFAISAEGGVPFIDDFDLFGNPGNGFFNDDSVGASTFTFVSELQGELFTFDSLDIIGDLFGATSTDVTVQGYLNGNLQQTDIYPPADTWSTVTAGNLAGVEVDRLDIVMIEFGTSADNLRLTTTGEQTCTWDLDGDDVVGTGDLILLLGSWGDPYGTPDLIALLGAWGPCPK